MRPALWRCIAALLLWAGTSTSASRAQLPPGLPPPPQLPQPPAAASPSQPDAAAMQRCVPRYGPSGCAARVYAELLCSLGDQGQPQAVQAGQRWLARSYEQAGLSFSGLSPAQIEQQAVEEQVPQLCPDSSDAIRRLFSGRLRP